MEVEEGPGQLAVEVLGEAGPGGLEVLVHALPLQVAHPPDPLVLEGGQGGEQEQEEDGDGRRQESCALPGSHGEIRIAGDRRGSAKTLHSLQLRAGSPP